MQENSYMQELDEIQLDENIEEPEEFINEEKKEWVENRGKYLHLQNSSANEVFAVFYKDWGRWVEKRASSLSFIKGFEKKDVYQFLMMQAWQAACDERFDPNMVHGKTIIGWMIKRVEWYARNLLNSKKSNPLSSVQAVSVEEIESKYEIDSDSIRPSESNFSDSLSGSVQLGAFSRRLEAFQLLKKVFEASKALPEQYSQMIQEIINPSEKFKCFMSIRKGYTGAAVCETCGIEDIIEYMNENGCCLDRTDLQKAIRSLKKRVKELSDF